MKRNLLIIVAIVVGIVAVMLAGNIIVIGDKLGQLTHPYVELGFYATMLLLFVVFIIRPIVRIHRAPELPKLSVDNQSSVKELRTFGRRLAKNCGYIHNAEQRTKHSAELLQRVSQSEDAEELRGLVGEELRLRIEGDKAQDIVGINGRIHQWAVTVFMVTAVSQSSKIDSLSVIYLNYKMIEELILASGFKPTRQQLFKQYGRILGTALISYVASELTDDIDLASSATEDAIEDATTDGSVGATLISKLRSMPLVSGVAGSVIDGAMNALLTLRIGYVTRSYLVEGSEAFTGYEQRRRIRRKAIKESMMALPSVVAKGLKGVGGKAAKLFASLVAKGGEQASGQ